MQDIISKEKYFEHSIERVWKAISDGKELSTWFIEADFKAEKGYSYTFKASEEHDCVNITGIVKTASPYTLIYTWKVQDTNIDTTVKWVLEEVEGGTRLVLEHSGISQYPAENAVAMFNDFNGRLG